MVTDSALTVSQLNTYVKMMFDSDSRLKRICVVGEISNFVNHYKTGHCYFSLKDEKSAVKAVMFAGSVQYLKFRPENGMRVYITGRVSVFERDGVYQIYAESMEPEGVGALMIAFEQLKKKLTAEGLFDNSNKKPLPQFPQKIGVVTSPVGAALQDIINVLSRRYPIAEIVFCPVAVQGVNCASENIKAINQLNTKNDIDLIIMGRGGGSVEDLWGYNDEQLVRAVASSKIPIISGVGHETDFTLCDFASDMRAPTPSAAAEIAVPDIEELYQLTDNLIFRADNAVDNYINTKKDYAKHLAMQLSLLDPRRIIENRSGEILSINKRLDIAINGIFAKNEAKLSVLSEKLKLLNPLFMIEKGYIPVYSNKKRVFEVNQLQKGDTITLNFVDGQAVCDVVDIKNTEN
ncbi:MAG: exodeoxyribonuclease VII large subunit [Clostridia bacterium]|nr:exodeoxyribonuclease VII large subunit [Clostridia bacterium]